MAIVNPPPYPTQESLKEHTVWNELYEDNETLVNIMLTY